MPSDGTGHDKHCLRPVPEGGCPLLVQAGWEELVLPLKFEMDGRLSSGPVLVPLQEARDCGNSGGDSPLNCRVWSTNPGAAGLNGEEFLNTLLVEVQHLWCEHAQTQVVLLLAAVRLRAITMAYVELCEVWDIITVCIKVVT
ncbi:hypothetical protein BV20DRAFT_983934 [Pilatotrama ljubarskyi]|nr:hypothetical protein BV20DRAFT_983934 [Pilatotrama ljubarskyi]